MLNQQENMYIFLKMWWVFNPCHHFFCIQPQIGFNFKGFNVKGNICMIQSRN